MATTIEMIKVWLECAPSGATHMMVICDTFDHEDFPRYIFKGEDARQHAGNLESMERLMEVYSFSPNHSLEDQLSQSGRVFNYD